MTRSPHPDRLGPLLILGAALLWSTGGIGIKSVELPPLATAGWRSFFALPALIAFGGTRGLRRGLLRESSMLVTIVAYAATLCLFVTATRWTTAANAILLQFTSPIWIIAISRVFLKQSPAKRDLWLAAGCMAGLSLFFLDRFSPEGFRGMLLAIVSGGTMAVLALGLRSQGLRGRQSAAMTAVLVGNVLSVILCLPWMGSALVLSGRNDWAILAGLGVFQIAIPYMLFSWGLRHIPALRATLIGLVEPVLNPLWVALFRGEIPGPWATAGGCVILGFLILDALVHRTRRALQP